ncbi:MAG: MFS transporter [Burkholderiaceae bacterium]
MSSGPGVHAAGAGLPRAVWVLGLVSLLMDVSSEMIHSLLPAFMVGTLGASALAVGLIEGVAESIALVARLFSGALSDTLGRRKPLAVLGYGLGALSKPLFALAPTLGVVAGARFVDRIGKGLRGAPRDALVADLVPRGQRGAAFGLRQALDTVGAVAGPLLAVALMSAWADDFRAVFAVAIVPGVLAVVLLVLGVREPALPVSRVARIPGRSARLRHLGGAYWWVVALGAVTSLARFSEAFLVLRAQQSGIALALLPMVMVAMNLVYAAVAYPFGRLADRVDHARLLGAGLLALLAADVVLAMGPRPAYLFGGVLLRGVHLGLTQGLFGAMIAEVAPESSRGTAYGVFGLVTGVALLASSAIAGLIWDLAGATGTFIAGAVGCVLALGGLGLRRGLAERRVGGP